jgi:hypothetical protein
MTLPLEAAVGKFEQLSLLSFFPGYCASGADYSIGYFVAVVNAGRLPGRVGEGLEQLAVYSKYLEEAVFCYDAATAQFYAIHVGTTDRRAKLYHCGDGRVFWTGSGVAVVHGETPGTRWYHFIMYLSVGGDDPTPVRVVSCAAPNGSLVYFC